MSTNITKAQRLFDALKLISRYDSPARVRRTAPKMGLDESEALEMAYENIISEAKTALGRMQRPSEDISAFHPLEDSDVLNQSASALENYRVDDRRSRMSYVSQRLLHVALLAYLKHGDCEDIIGWNALHDELHAAICEAIGDDEFCKWIETTSKA